MNGIMDMTIQNQGFGTRRKGRASSTQEFRLASAIQISELAVEMTQ